MSFEALPRAHYAAIYADPPRRYRTYNDRGRSRCPDWKPYKGSPVRHYETAAIEDIRALPVASLAADDCALFLWITWPLLLDALSVIDAWGFEYKSCAFAWMKAHADQIEMFRDDFDALMG